MTRVRGALATAAAVIACVLLAGCATAGDEGGPDPQLRGQWELTGASDAGGAMDLVNQHITLTIDGDTSTSGRSACSAYRAQLFGSVDSLWVRTELPRTEDCGSRLQLALEQRYFAALQSVRSATVDGGVLELTSPEATLDFARALTRPVDLVVDRLWKLTGMSSVSFFDARITDGDPGAESGFGVDMSFGANGDFQSHTGCETLRGAWTQNAGEIVVSRVVASVEMPCASTVAGIMTDVRKVIDSSFTFQTSTDGLILVSSRAGIALFFGLSG